MTELEKLVKLSKYAGERFDLVQGGGGNTSVKLNDGTMLVKSSGTMLSDVSLTRGYSRVNTNIVLRILGSEGLNNSIGKMGKDDVSAQLLIGTLVESNNRPSIETFLHALYYKFTLHVHPIIVNAATCRKDWKKILEIFPKQKVALVEYKTPGIELGIELKKVFGKFRTKPKITFMQNHGLIVSSNIFEEIIEITECTVTRLEEFFQVNFQDYKLTNKISKLINSVEKTHFVSLLSTDSVINSFIKEKKELFNCKPFCPDGLVYFGMRPLEFESLEDNDAIIGYKRNFHELPRVVIYNNHIFFIAENINKAKEIEEVFK